KSAAISNNVDQNILSYGKNACLFFLRKFIIVNDYQKAWEFANTLQDKKLIQNILFVMENWSNPLSYTLFEKCKDFEEVDSFSYYHVLDKIAKKIPDYALSRLAQILPKHYGAADSRQDYEEKDVLKTLATMCPEKLFPVLFRSMQEDFDEGLDDFD